MTPQQATTVRELLNDMYSKGTGTPAHWKNTPELDAVMDEAEAKLEALFAEREKAAELRGRIDENRIAYEWDRSKGLQYFEERLQKRQAKLCEQLALAVPNGGKDDD